jgi:hypothetical protein
MCLSVTLANTILTYGCNHMFSRVIWWSIVCFCCFVSASQLRRMLLSACITRVAASQCTAPLRSKVLCSFLHPVRTLCLYTSPAVFPVRICVSLVYQYQKFTRYWFSGLRPFSGTVTQQRIQRFGN